MNLISKTFWVVTKPNECSELCDICFEADIESMMLQALGGLYPENVLGIYDNEDEATHCAKKLMYLIFDK